MQLLLLFCISAVSILSPSFALADDFVLTAAFARQKGLRTGAPVLFLGSRVGRVLSMRKSDQRSDLARPYLLELSVSGTTLDRLREGKGAVAIVSVTSAEGEGPSGVSVELVPSAEGRLPPSTLEGFGSFEEFWLADAGVAHRPPAKAPQKP